MKGITTLFCLIAITIQLFGQDTNLTISVRRPDVDLQGKWRCLVKDSCLSDYWEFKENGRVEIVIDCGGPCEGSIETSYVDEAGTWKLQGDSLLVTLNENNGKPYSTKPQVMRFYIVRLNAKELEILESSGKRPYPLKFERI